MKPIVLTFLVFALALSAFAQSQQDGDKLVYVPQRYVSAEGLTHEAAPPVSTVSTVIGWGKELGTAMHEGLAAVVDQTDRFGATRVGTFVMTMVAWKIMGKDVEGIVLGIPITFIGIAIWMWSIRRFLIGYRVVASVEGPFFHRKKTYVDHDPYKFDNDSARLACGIVHVGAIALWVIIMFSSVVF